MKWSQFVLSALLIVIACFNTEPSYAKQVDTLIINGEVYIGDGSGKQQLDIAICGEIICGVFSAGKENISAKTVVDASGKIVSPGFIDPHTHSLSELLSRDKNHNLNYLMQGVTTVVNGNDGGGTFDIAALANKLETNGIGTNVALFVGHNAVRKQVMGKENRYSTLAELQKMQQLVKQAMEQGAIGLSTGLYYVPGNYASTKEVVALAKVAAEFGGIYDTHLRDEATFNIGFIAALNEAIAITDEAGIHLHLAHIKALGVDAWGLSEEAISIIENAQKRGASISADQYPWLASGTKLRNAVMPKWAMADSTKAFYQRLNDPLLKTRLSSEIQENIRRRGGGSALLVTAAKNKKLVGKTLKQLADDYKLSESEAAIKLVQTGQIRVASFNMSPADLQNFMRKSWVVTSSDGTNGHPRKFASFPKKFESYVMDNPLLTIDEFITRSSGQTAKILGLSDRGVLKQGLAADILIWQQEDYKANANFKNWNVLSSGINDLWVNGTRVIEAGNYNRTLAGKFVSK